MERLSRLSFVKVAGAATGAAAIASAPSLARAAVEGEPEQVDPTTGVPHESLVAYVRDVESGEVTVVSGSREATYRDRQLVKRMLRAASRTKDVS